MAQTGMGTEKLEESLHRLFPQAKVVRMDADAVRKKNAHQMLLDQFETEGDILVGTQMVAKGLDFERVTLVGILSADSALARMDYRSAETAYAMLEQASGRAGRGRLPGQVIIQTFDQHHYVMESVAQHAYLKFFQEEMQWRRLGSYPPYVYMCTLVFSHEDNARLMAKAQEAKTMLAPLRVLGPAAISMRKGKNRLRLLVKDKDQAALEKGVWNVVNRLALKGVGLEVNMHPLMLEE
jgi:primosomal protein N' (replication factor Y)